MPSCSVASSEENYIQRLETGGGSASNDTCDAGHNGAESRVPYTAQYLFYAPQQ